MCLLKSGLILKDRVFLPDYDSHDRMLSELKIKDSKYNAEHTFVRFELHPKNDDPFTPIDEWTYRVDQDILPDWYVKSYDQKRATEAVKGWVKEHVIIDSQNLQLSEGIYYIKNSTVTAYGSSTVTAYIVTVGGLYKVQVGAYSVKANADAMAEKLKAAGYDNFITTNSGVATAIGSTAPAPATIKKGSTVKVKSGAKTYTGGGQAFRPYLDFLMGV